MTNLKPCPFCGSFDITLKEQWYDSYKSDPVYYVLCEYCGTEGPWSVSMKDVIEHWNTRVKENR